MSTALIAVDIQNDFVPGGALPVAEGHLVVPVINQLMRQDFDVVVATKDWHPADHGSFAAQHAKAPGDRVILGGIEQILWPTHCVQNSWGSDFAPGFDMAHLHKVFYKGSDKNIDSYSVFFDNGHHKGTGLVEYLLERNVRAVYIAGLATDYCVKFSVLDALKLGFTTYVIQDACRGVDIAPQDSENALKDMQSAGAQIIFSHEVEHCLKSAEKQTT